MRFYQRLGFGERKVEFLFFLSELLFLLSLENWVDLCFIRDPACSA